MKALTIRQPWAHCAAVGAKLVENRPWKPRSMQPGDELAIHAGLVQDESWRHGGPGLRRAVEAALANRPVELLETGEVLAVVRLAGWHRPVMVDTLFGAEVCCQPWGFVGGWHWELEDARPMEGRFPAGGGQSLWDLPVEVEAAVREQLAVPA